MNNKSGTPNSLPTKSLIFNWIFQIIPDSSSKIKFQELGTGVIYCRLINHYFPHSINLNRVNNNPKNQYQYIQNLKLFQNALILNKINIPLDSNKIAKLKFLQNWALINSLYKHFVSDQISTNLIDDCKSVIGSITQPKSTPKKSFQMAFSNQYKQKAIQIQNQPTKMIHYNSMGVLGQQTNSMNSLVGQHSNILSSLRQQSNSINSTNQSLNRSSFLNSSKYQSQIVENHHQTMKPMTNYNLNNFNQNLVPPSQLGFSNYGNLYNQNSSNLHLNNLGLSSGFSSNSINQSIQSQFRQPLAQKQLNCFLNNSSNISSNLSNIMNMNLSSQNSLQNQNKCWSVGKLTNRQQIFAHHNQQGKYSVNSHITQNNYNAIIDRVKQILLKASHDVQKIRQVKLLLNIPLNQDPIVKVQEGQNQMVNFTNNKDNSNQSQKQKVTKQIAQNQTLSSKQNICIKQDEKQKVNIQSVILKPDIKQLVSKKELQLSIRKKQMNRIVNPNQSSLKKQDKNPFNSGKKIKNNFFGQGIFFRK